MYERVFEFGGNWEGASSKFESTSPCIDDDVVGCEFLNVVYYCLKEGREEGVNVDLNLNGGVGDVPEGKDDG